MIQKKVFDKIYEKFAGDVKKNIRRRIKDENAVEDLCQEIFNEFYNKMETVDCTNLNGIRSWLLVSSGYRVKDFIRKGARDKSLMEKVLYQENLGGNASGMVASAEELVLRKENARLRKEVLEKARELYPEEFEMMIRKECKGEATEDIAREFNITVNNLYTKIYRLKMKMREELKKRMEGGCQA